MIYDIDNTAKAGKPCRVFDAAGNELRFVVSCDTDTGDVVRLAHDGNSFVLDETGGAIKQITERVPAPLRVEPLPPNA